MEECPRRVMRIIRYEYTAGRIHYGVQEADGSRRRAEGDPFAGIQSAGEKADVRRLLAPVEPAMIWCIGQNYRLHSNEVGMKLPDYPVVFAKSPNAAIGEGEAIQLPWCGRSEEVDYEGELVVVIGKRCRNVDRKRAL